MEYHVIKYNFLLSHSNYVDHYVYFIFDKFRYTYIINDILFLEVTNNFSTLSFSIDNERNLIIKYETSKDCISIVCGKTEIIEEYRHITFIFGNFSFNFYNSCNYDGNNILGKLYDFSMKDFTLDFTKFNFSISLRHKINKNTWIFNGSIIKDVDYVTYYD